MREEEEGVGEEVPGVPEVEEGGEEGPEVVVPVLEDAEVGEGHQQLGHQLPVPAHVGIVRFIKICRSCDGFTPRWQQ